MNNQTEEITKIFDAVSNRDHISTVHLMITLPSAFNPRSDQHLISLHSNTAELFTKTMKVKEMIVNLRSFDC